MRKGFYPMVSNLVCCSPSFAFRAMKKNWYDVSSHLLSALKCLVLFVVLQAHYYNSHSNITDGG
jgi:hypothetical protein